MTLDEVLKDVDELKLLYDKHKLSPSKDRDGLFILADEVRRLRAENERLREGLEHYATNRHWHWNPDRGAWEYNASGSAYYRGCTPLARSTDLPDQEAVDAECGSIARAALSD